MVSIFEKYGYTVIQTDPDASYKNYPDEIPRTYIAESFRSLVQGHQVPLKIWPYYLSHYIKVRGMVLHGE